MNVRYFEDAVTFSQRFHAKGGKYDVSGRLVYGSCNDQMCLPPTSVDFNYNGEAPKTQEKEKEEDKKKEEASTSKEEAEEQADANKPESITQDSASIQDTAFVAQDSASIQQLTTTPPTSRMATTEVCSLSSSWDSSEVLWHFSHHVCGP